LSNVVSIEFSPQVRGAVSVVVPPVVAFTGIHDVDVQFAFSQPLAHHSTRQQIKALGGKTSDVVAECTHLFVDDKVSDPTAALL
jgi:hypothetical protein